MSLPVSHAVIFSSSELSLYIYYVVEAPESEEGIAISWKLDAEANREARVRKRERYQDNFYGWSVKTAWSETF